MCRTENDLRGTQNIEEAGKTKSFSENKICKECVTEYGFCPESKCYEHNFNQDGTPKVCEDYTPSSTNRDYSPSNPWDAPGMSIKDFI